MEHILSLDVDYDNEWIGIIQVINKISYSTTLERLDEIQVKVSKVTLDQKPK